MSIIYRGKTHYLGLYGSPESHIAYSRLVAEIQANPALDLPKGESDVTVRELAVAFLDHAEANTDPITYITFRVIVLDFLDKLYGDNISVDNFKPSCLKLVRAEMVKSRRFCRNTLNRHTRRIISIFEWGVENELVQETTWNALKAVGHGRIKWIWRIAEWIRFDCYCVRKRQSVHISCYSRATVGVFDFSFSYNQPLTSQFFHGG